MKYHINYDGRILPCRAKVKKCPYGPSRHADSYEELYLRAMQLYNHAPVDNDLKVKLNSGKMLSDLSPISPELEKSKAPIETLLSTLKYAMSSVDSGKMPYELKKEENAAANSCARIIALDSTIPQWVPQNVKDKANDIFARSNYKLEKWSPGFANDNDVKDQREYLEDHKKEIILTKSWHNTHVEVPENIRTKYAKKYKDDFNFYSQALNTSKMLAQPRFNNIQTLEQDISIMNNIDLLSFYDNCTVSDREVMKNLSNVNNFQYKYRADLSAKANDNLENWFKHNQVLAKKYVISSSTRVLASVCVAKELYKRKINFGDNIRIDKEKE